MCWLIDLHKQTALACLVLSLNTCSDHMQALCGVGCFSCPLKRRPWQNQHQAPHCLPYIHMHHMSANVYQLKHRAPEQVLDGATLSTSASCASHTRLVKKDHSHLVSGGKTLDNRVQHHVSSSTSCIDVAEHLCTHLYLSLTRSSLLSKNETL